MNQTRSEQLISSLNNIKENICKIKQYSSNINNCSTYLSNAEIEIIHAIDEIRKERNKK